MEIEQVLAQLESMGDPHDRAGMARFGINVEHALGISVGELRRFARDLGKDHELALQLWDSGIHEARILATIVDEHEATTLTQLERWARDFDSWDLVDQCCSNLVSKTAHARTLVERWTRRDEEFVKRAGFSLIAYLAVHAKGDPDESFGPYLGLIERSADDGRNYVKKAVSWALRQIGKRSSVLLSRAIEVAERLRTRDDRAARWIGNDAYRELSRRKG